MKILVVGFPRSGTSLTQRIFAKHPDVKGMLFEKWAIKSKVNKKELIKRYPMFNFTCGEKVIWEKQIIGKVGKTTDSIIDYCLKWNDWFQDEAKIIQIIRHPFDSLNSLVLSKRRFARGPSFSSIYPQFLDNASRFIEEINSLHNCMTIKYETLVSDPSVTIRKLYRHCKINENFKYSEKMKTGRIFNYFKRKNLLFEYDERLAGIIKDFNKISGVKYLDL